VTAEQIKEFRETQLPEYRDLASSKTTKEMYLKETKRRSGQLTASGDCEKKEKRRRPLQIFLYVALAQ